MLALLTERPYRATAVGEALRAMACHLASAVSSANTVTRIDAVVCVGPFFDALGREFGECLDRELASLRSAVEVLAVNPESRLLGAWRCAASALAGPGVWVSAGRQSSRLHLSARREIRYSVVHPAGRVLDLANPAIADAAAGRPVLAVVDSQIDTLYGGALRAYISKHLNSAGYVLLDGSEREKSRNQVERILKEAIRLKLPRAGLVMAVGGGVTLDVAGFAASIFRRGIGHLRVPTSLIGLVDVGVGIKQGINAGHGKSIIGAYHPAIATINDLTFLSTLPRRHLACGLAEIVKMAIVRDAQLFDLLERHAPELLACRFQEHSAASEIILRAEHSMMQELQPNLFEQDTRRLVDFGHTFSPLIESASGYSIRHGEAVAIDMLLSTRIAVSRGLCSHDDLDRIECLLRRIGLPLTASVCDVELMAEAIGNARAHRAGRLNLVVPARIGQGDFVQDLSRSELEEALESVSEQYQVQRAGHSH